jgi:hypothetical protein
VVFILLKLPVRGVVSLGCKVAGALDGAKQKSTMEVV